MFKDAHRRKCTKPSTHRLARVHKVMLHSIVVAILKAWVWVQPIYSVVAEHTGVCIIPPFSNRTTPHRGMMAMRHMIVYATTSPGEEEKTRSQSLQLYDIERSLDVELFARRVICIVVVVGTLWTSENARRWENTCVCHLHVNVCRGRSHVVRVFRRQIRGSTRGNCRWLRFGGVRNPPSSLWEVSDEK